MNPNRKMNQASSTVSSWSSFPLEKKREILCSIIVNLPKHASIDFIEQAIMKHTRQQEQPAMTLSSTKITNPNTTETTNNSFKMTNHDSNDDKNDVLVSPLMLACMQSQVGCLEYILKRLEQQQQQQQQEIFQLWGTVTEPNLHPYGGGNCTIHYASLSGCEPILDLLISIHHQFQRYKQKKSSTKKLESINKISSQAYLDIMKIQNLHNDTPVMMACVKGQVTFLRHWIQQTLSFANDGNKNDSHNTSKQLKEKLREIMGMTNDASDCALSLAYGHGNVHVLQFLLGDDPFCHYVAVQYQHIHACQSILKKSKVLISSLQKKQRLLLLEHQNNETTEDVKKNKQFLQECEERHDKIQKCLTLMEQRLSKTVQQNEQDLLKMVDDEQKFEEIKKIECSSNKKKKKKKGKKQTFKNHQSHPSIEDEKKLPTFASLNTNSKQANDQNPSKHLSTIQTATLAKSAPTKTTDIMIDEQEALDKSVEQTSTVTISMNDLLRERYIKPIKLEETTRALRTNEIKEENIKSQSEAVMESLCLDASMLLLTPHGMAMNLSPCQLEAVETILINQSDAVQEAKAIQNRLYSNN